MENKNQNIGNPLVAAAVAQNPTVQRFAIGLASLTVLGVGTYFGYKEYQKYRAKQVLRKGTKEVIQAVKLRAAMFTGSDFFPAGQSFFMSMLPDISFFNNTDERAVGKIASEITNWKQVQEDYSEMFFSELLSDLQSQLSSEEYKSFFAILNKDSEKDTNLQEQGRTTYAVGETIYAFKDGVISYDDINRTIKDDTWDMGEEIGVIKKTFALTRDGVKTGKYIYLVDKSWCAIVNCDIYVRHEDVDNVKRELNGIPNYKNLIP